MRAGRAVYARDLAALRAFRDSAAMVVRKKQRRPGNPCLSLEPGGGVLDLRLAAMAGIGIRRLRLLGQLNTSGASGAILGLHLPAF